MGAWIRATPMLAAGAGFLLLYWPVLARLAQDWIRDDNFSHGFLIIPMACYVAWDRRRQFAATTVAPQAIGLVVVVGGLGLLLAGQLGAELFLTRVSMLVVIAGVVLFLFGGRALGLATFPIGFLLLMIPLPALVFNQMAFPLQLFASQVGEATLSTLGVPVLREGNVIILAHTTLEVAEACSGIRSLISLLTLGMVYGYFIDRRGGVRALITLTTIPIAVVVNGARVAGTGVAAHYFGTAAAEGFFHTFSGWLVFIAAFLLVFGVAQVLVRLAPRPIPAPVGALA